MFLKKTFKKLRKNRKRLPRTARKALTYHLSLDKKLQPEKEIPSKILEVVVINTIKSNNIEQYESEQHGFHPSLLLSFIFISSFKILSLLYWTQFLIATVAVITSVIIHVKPWTTFIVSTFYRCQTFGSVASIY